MRHLLPFLLLLISTSTLAESGAYRVEVIVFRNLDVLTDSVTEDELRNFSRYPGLENVEPDRSESAEASLEIHGRAVPPVAASRWGH